MKRESPPVKHLLIPYSSILIFTSPGARPLDDDEGVESCRGSLNGRPVRQNRLVAVSRDSAMRSAPFAATGSHLAVPPCSRVNNLHSLFKAVPRATGSKAGDIFDVRHRMPQLFPFRPRDARPPKLTIPMCAPTSYTTEPL